MVVKRNEYVTISSNYGPDELREKGSRFISYAYSVKDASEADLIIAGLRKEFKDANHVCFAFRLGDDAGNETYFRYNDDGEPGSTAGLPIYNEIKSKGYLNVLCAVIRYFGGTKLGTGGLVRAYGASARAVLNISKPVIVQIKKKISFDFPYALTGEIMHLVEKYSLDIIDRQYNGSGVSIKLAVPVAKEDVVKRSVTDISSGKIKL
jgi:uncharacterized YigZ family protein